MITCSYAFAPQLREGQRLRFRIKVVPTTWTRTVASPKTKRQDVIMAAWQRLPETDRDDPERLEATAQSAACAWLQRQGEQRGFSLTDQVEVLAYDRRRLSTGRGNRRIIFGAVTFEGGLEVHDVDQFRRTLAEGLGTSRAFGDGLLQIEP